MADDQQEDIQEFEALVKTGEADPHPYERLMIHYRKQKNYKKELRVINKAIKVFTDQLSRQQTAMFKGAKSRTTIQKVSLQISRSVGLTDKKGNPNYLPEPLAKWEKRKHTVEEKMRKDKA